MKKTWTMVVLLTCVGFTSVCALDLNGLAVLGSRFEFSTRQAQYLLSGGRHEAVRRNPLFSGGVLVGKRLRLPWSFRVQASLCLNYGSMIEDTLPEAYFSDGLIHVPLLKAAFLFGSGIVDVQYPLDIGSNRAVFLHGGGGFHLLNKYETESTTDNPPIRINDSYLEEATCKSASIHCGIGGEMAVTRVFGIAVSYSMRYWYPVDYQTSRLLFPYKSIPYRERFFSHEIDIQLLAKRR